MGSRENLTSKTRASNRHSSHHNTNEVNTHTFICSNMNSVIGLVSIPGMMTGAILGGASISQAVKYQQIIMFLISATTLLAVTMSVCICVMVCIDTNHRLRPDRVTGTKPWMWRMRDNTANAIWRGIKFGWRRITCRYYSEDEEHEENGHHRRE